MTYFDLSVPMSSLLICILSLELCCGGYLLLMACQKKQQLSILLLLCSVLLSSSLMIVYTAEARARLLDLSIPSISLWLCSLPLWIPGCIIVGMMAYLICLLIGQIRYRRNTITRTSIQEGINKLTSGLCYYRDGGRITLVNSRMLELCHQIVGRDLQNAVLFWEILSSGQVLQGVTRMSTGNSPSFRLQDGSVWTFTYENLNGIHQLTAAETTQIQAVTEELKEKNLQLAVLNQRLRTYGENVSELTRSKERLETKARIHAELGQALLATRRYIFDGCTESSTMLELWQQSIAMLRKEAQMIEDEQPMDMLARIASQTGITTCCSGDFPVAKDTQKLFVQAAAEALTNAISHARAGTLYIRFTSDGHYDAVEFTNDGIPPDGPITEGGGLSSLRAKVEERGGTMTVTGKPDFVLHIILPKTGGELDVSCFVGGR